jgi:hypothetical protein
MRHASRRRTIQLSAKFEDQRILGILTLVETRRARQGLRMPALRPGDRTEDDLTEISLDNVLALIADQQG